MIIHPFIVWLSSIYINPSLALYTNTDNDSKTTTGALFALAVASFLVSSLISFFLGVLVTNLFYGKNWTLKMVGTYAIIHTITAVIVSVLCLVVVSN